MSVRLKGKIDDSKNWMLIIKVMVVWNSASVHTAFKFHMAIFNSDKLQQMKSLIEC